MDEGEGAMWGALMPSSVRRVMVCGMLFVLCAFAGCSRKKMAVAPPASPPIDAEAVAFVAEGDRHMLEPHLYGWRQAEAAYGKAYGLDRLAETRKKLLFARFLILIRQLDEDIPYARTDEVIGELCAGDPFQKKLCSVAQWIKRGRKPDELTAAPRFSGEHPEVESYLNLLVFEAAPVRDLFPGVLKGEGRRSPLFLYLNNGALARMPPVEFERAHPRYAEGFGQLAEALFATKKYAGARTYFRKALELVPDYPRLLVGLGNVYLYGVGDVGEALRQYEKALVRDPSYMTALYGKASALQQMGRYEESNETSDVMLAANIPRNRWVGGVPDVRYYQGMGRYLKAYNHYMTNDRVGARALIDQAKEALPDSGDVNYLSGMLFYQANEIEAARKDFVKVTEDGSGSWNCNAQLHLGLVYQKMKENGLSEPPEPLKQAPEGVAMKSSKPQSVAEKAVTHFVSAGICLQQSADSLQRDITMLDSSDFVPAERATIKERLEKKLTDLRATSCSSIQMILSRVAGDKGYETDFFQRLMNENLSNLRCRELPVP